MALLAVVADGLERQESLADEGRSANWSSGHFRSRRAPVVLLVIALPVVLQGRDLGTRT